MPNPTGVALCAPDVEETVRIAIPQANLIVVPTMKEGTWIIMNVPLEKAVETMKAAMETP